jgi:tetratricopeptide (TPR) repeat protein
LAIDYFYLDKPEVSFDFFERIGRMGEQVSESSQLYSNLGLSAFYGGRYDHVNQSFLTALNNTNDPLVKSDIWYNLSFIAIGMGDYQRAIKCLWKSVSFNDEHLEAQTNLAVLIYETDGDLSVVLPLLQKAVRYNLSFESAFNLALFLYYDGDLKTAITWISKACKLSESNPQYDAILLQSIIQEELHQY